MIDSVAIAIKTKGVSIVFDDSYFFSYGPSFAGGGSDTSTYGRCYDRKAFEEGRLEEYREEDDNENEEDKTK